MELNESESPTDPESRYLAPDPLDWVAPKGMDMDFSSQDTAVVITDPQNDFLSPEGVTWELVGASVEANDTVAHLEQLFQAADAGG